MLNKKFIDRLKEYRIENQLTYIEMGRKIGLGGGVVRKINGDK